MCLSHPEYLAFLWLLLPVALFSLLGISRKERLRRRLSGDEGRSGILPETVVRRALLFLAMRVTGAGFLLFAMAGPELCSGLKPVPGGKADIVFLLDVSESMRARDVAPDRLSEAKSEILRISRAAGGSRKALVLFAGTAVVQCPLTPDQSFFETLLDMASPDLIELQGTVYRRAFETAMQLAAPGGGRTLLVLVSDGEDHGGDFRKAAAELGDRKIPLYVIGIGSGDPAGIPVSGAFMRDRSGEVVLTQFRPEVLGAVVSQAGGLFYHSVPGDSTGTLVAGDVAREASAARWRMVPGKRQPVHDLFILGGILLLLPAQFLPESRLHRRS